MRVFIRVDRGLGTTYHHVMRRFLNRFAVHEIAPDEIFLDSSNLPRLDESQFEGRVERPLFTPLVAIGVFFVAVTVLFLGRALYLQGVQGSVYADIARINRLDRTVLFAPRGVIFDRQGVKLAWNEAFASAEEESTEEGPANDSQGGSLSHTESAPLRRYTEMPGFAHVLGFVRYPRKDADGNWWRDEYVGVAGAEFTYDDILRGVNGSRMVETTALGEVARSHIVVPEKAGDDIYLSLDAAVQAKLSSTLAVHAEQHGFVGASGAVMDVQTGELLALTNVPEYNHQAFSEGDADAVARANRDSRAPLLNRAVSGLYAPGSIVKPIFAAAALSLDIITPETKILSTGALTVPNPYDASKPTIFRDWKAHGWVDVRDAIAVSSDQYFYVIGGGKAPRADIAVDGFFREGLGIERIEKYARMFGLGAITGIPLLGEETGTIPNPVWKESVFENGDPWRLGDTYHTAIGQFGFQMTLIQAVRFAAAIANDGILVAPQLIRGESPRGDRIDVEQAALGIVREGMRAAVSSDLQNRTARALDISGLEISAKTGTAQVGRRNEFMNSWVIGYWPSSNPRYAFAVVLEKAPAGTLAGASPALRPFFEWLIAHKPEYLN